MRIIRQIDVFDINTDRLVEEILIETFDLNTFRKRFEKRENDPLMHGVYKISNSTSDLFPNINFDFNKYAYVITSYQTDEN